eukprot:11199145-Lingulodinium_polyedra.AAC.1
MRAAFWQGRDFESPAAAEEDEERVEFTCELKRGGGRDVWGGLQHEGSVHGTPTHDAGRSARCEGHDLEVGAGESVPGVQEHFLLQ